jgi:hypothetical protein
VKRILIDQIEGARYCVKTVLAHVVFSESMVNQLRYVLIYVLNELTQSFRGEVLYIGVVFFSDDWYPG